MVPTLLDNAHSTARGGTHMPKPPLCGNTLLLLHPREDVQI